MAAVGQKQSFNALQLGLWKAFSRLGAVNGSLGVVSLQTRFPSLLPH